MSSKAAKCRAPVGVQLRKVPDYRALQQKLSFELGDILIRPLVENTVVSGKQHWIFSTDSALSSIPLEALINFLYQAFAGKFARWLFLSFVPVYGHISLWFSDRDGPESPVPGVGPLLRHKGLSPYCGGTHGS